MIRNVLHTLGSLRSALAAAVGLPLVIAGSAFAQNPSPSPAAQTEATTERVEVTGSYIPTAETESALPVAVYSADALKSDPTANRKLIRNATAELEVVSFEDSVQKITAFVSEEKGYVATTSSEKQ